MAQLLANENSAQSHVPKPGYIFENLEGLLQGVPHERRGKILQRLRSYWNDLPREGSSIQVQDGGVLADVISKMAQREGLKNYLDPNHYYSPVEIYDKHTGDLYAGVDNWDVLTDPSVLKAGGYTHDILEHYAKQKSIFSLSSYKDQLFSFLNVSSIHKQGERMYEDLQASWIDTQEDLVDVKELLWLAYRDSKHAAHGLIKEMVDHYISAVFSSCSPEEVESIPPIVRRRITTHMFSAASYAYLLDTFTRGNPPGHHLEDHLASGDPEHGSTKMHLALGQGDMEQLDATEILTGYSVMLHTPRVEEGDPVPYMIKLDTERSPDEPLTGEENQVALGNFREALKLWPYILVGDIIPVVAIRSVRKRDISRVGYSIVGAFTDIISQLEDNRLPHFVNAARENGQVILVPGKEIIHAALRVNGDLRLFRKEIYKLAELHNDPWLQNSYQIGNQSYGF